jgi:hypothetical protein
MPTIKHIPFGIACRIGNTIYIHKDMEKFSVGLYNAILEHERSHTSHLTLHDILIDLENRHLDGLKKEYYNFILTHPTTLVELMPVWKYDGKYVWNLLLCLFYLGLGGIAWLIVSLLK